jgi:hypothetical protein
MGVPRGDNGIRVCVSTSAALANTFMCAVWNTGWGINLDLYLEYVLSKNQARAKTMW